MIHRWKHSSVKQYGWALLQTAASVADALVKVVTLAFVWTDFEHEVLYAKLESEMNGYAKAKVKKQQPKAGQEDTNAI